VTRLDDEALVAALSDEARRVAASDAASEPAPGAWHRLEARRATERALSGRGWALRAGLGVAAGAAALALVLGVHAWRSGRPITYEVGGSAVEEGGYIRGGTAAGTEVQFSEGTRIDLAAGARLSVVAPGPHGARLRVEEGRAHFTVNHLPKAAWTVEAGPYVVEVTGTEFDVRWSSAEEIVEVRLHKGSVRVSGPMLTEHATLRPGQNLTAHLATRELRIDESPAAPGAVERHPPAASTPPASPPADVAPTAVAPAPGPAAPEGVAPAPAPPTDSHAAEAEAPRETRPAAAAPARSAKRSSRAIALASRSGLPGWAPATWAARVASGDAAGVVAEAVAHGIDGVVAEADGPTLAALADATRYVGRTYLAERVLRAQRTRFPGTPAAGAAAFFLGRLADDRGAFSEGLDWYGRYLTEQPDGPYAAEALGRKMLGVSRLSGRQAAHDLARDYLHRFPNGTYLLHAQAILNALPR